MNLPWVVVGKDLRLLWRQRAGWLSAAAFALISVLVYSFALDLAVADVRPLLPGVLWATFLFAGIIATGQSFAQEAEQGTFDAMLLAPVSCTSLYVAKVVSNMTALLAIELGVLVAGTVLFDTTLLTLELALIVLTGTLGYVSVSTLLSTLGARVPGRAVLLPVLALPLLVPLLIAATRATGGALGEPSGTAPWLLLLAVFTAWATLGGALLFPLVAER
ncbi:MAG: heme exporter protein CcmB [Dehalococcoidia bacterium]|jgi:heme exporter protein B|nr:heme exporter protein CcmB [Dehalococcoidia bacterium]